MDPLGEGDPQWVGRYRVQARLGSGGMGRVYLAFSPAGRAVAVKVIHPELARDPAFLARFRQEVAAARQVSGAYTAPVIDASGEAEDPPWLATAFVPGPSLTDAVAASGPLPPESLWRLAGGLVEALAVVHGHGLVHRDLKPANVLLAADGPRVIDFGISRALDVATATATGMIVGTASFMSPEQAEGLPIGPASDVFSLGCVLAYAATASVPFGVGTPASIIYRVVHSQPALDEISGPMRGLIASCLAKDLGKRATLAELLDGITAQLEPATATLSFWPLDLADSIATYQAQLISAAAPGTSPVSEGPATPLPHPPTRAVLASPHSPAAEETVTANDPNGTPASRHRPPAGTPAIADHPAPRRRHRGALVLTAAGSILAVAGVAALTLAANGKGPSSAPTATASTLTPRRAATSATAPTPTATALAGPTRSLPSNARLFVRGLAETTEASISALRNFVAGPVMVNYVRDQALQTEAAAVAGQQGHPGSVTRLPNGFKICWGAGQGCQSFTDFSSDSSGHITDLAVDGQLISGRLAVGTDSTSSGLVLSSVYSYLSTYDHRVYVTFKVRNIGSRTLGTVNPAFLPVLVTPDGTQFSADIAHSLLPNPVLPGESVVVSAAFDTQTITGRFSLRGNGQGNGQALVTSEIHKL